MKDLEGLRPGTCRKWWCAPCGTIPAAPNPKIWAQINENPHSRGRRSSPQGSTQPRVPGPGSNAAGGKLIDISRPSGSGGPAGRRRASLEPCRTSQGPPGPPRRSWGPPRKLRGCPGRSQDLPGGPRDLPGAPRIPLEVPGTPGGLARARDFGKMDMARELHPHQTPGDPWQAGVGRLRNN